MTRFRRFVPLLLLAGTAAQAQGFEDLAALDRKVAATLGAGFGEPGDRIRVRSETKKGAVIGMVMADGRVALPGFK